MRKKLSPKYETKRQRRAAVKSIINLLGQIKYSEEQYMSRIPENLQGSVVYDNAEQCVSCLDEAIDTLGLF
jgi:hypothetical protein